MPSSSGDNSIWRLHYNNTSPFNKSWTCALVTIYTLIFVVALVVSYVINHTYQSCYNSYEANYDGDRCNATQLSVGQRLYSDKFAYSIMNRHNYTQRPLSCTPNMNDGTTLVFYTTPFIPDIKYNITINCDDGMNMALVDHTLWSMNLIVRNWTNAIRDNYQCTQQHTLCCADTTNATCSYDCGSDGELIQGLQIKNPQTTTYNVYTASHQCHTDLTQNMTSELSAMIQNDIPSIGIDVPFQCRVCADVDREGWALFWLMVVGCISIVSLGLRFITVIAKFIYVGKLNDAARRSGVYQERPKHDVDEEMELSDPTTSTQQKQRLQHEEEDFSSEARLLKTS